MIRLDVCCALLDGAAFNAVGLIALDAQASAGDVLVQLGRDSTVVNVLDEKGAWPYPVHNLVARALARSLKSRPSSALTVSAVDCVTVDVIMFGVVHDVLRARCNGSKIYDFYGTLVEGERTRFQVWRLVRQMLHRCNLQPESAQHDMSIYRIGQTEYCRVFELPEELQAAFGICHALRPGPEVPNVPDACYREDMESFLEMLRLRRGYPPLSLRQR